MFIISSLFKKVKQKTTNGKKEYNVVQQASFKDLSGKNIEFEIRINGNNRLLSIKVENENQTEIVLDQEKAILLTVLAQSYAAHEVFPALDEEK